MEVPRLGVQLELLLLAYARATATRDLNCICDLHHSSQQRQILNPLNEARDRTRNLMVPTQICFRCTTTGTPKMTPTLEDAGLPLHHPLISRLRPLGGGEVLRSQGDTHWEPAASYQ